MQYRLDVWIEGGWRQDIYWLGPRSRVDAERVAVQAVSKDGYERSQLWEKEQDSVLPWRVVLEVAR